MCEYLLKLISLIKQNYCSSKYIYNLIPGEKTIRKDEYGKKCEEILVKDGEEFKNLWEDACKYAEKSREIIMNTGDADFGAIKMFYTGQIVGRGDFANEKINDHHIFPKQVKGLDPEKSKTFNDIRDSVVNRTLLLNETNNRIKSKKPSQYIAEMTDIYGNDNEVKSILKGHLITESVFECMKEDHFNNFVIEREEAIKQHIILKLKI